MKFGLQRRHLESVLDVEFAAVQTNEIGPLIFGPLLMILALLISRGSYLDDWKWPAGFVAVFILNLLLVVFCWWLVRQATENVRRDALERLAKVRSCVDNSGTKDYDIPVTENRQTPEKTLTLSQEQYLKNLDAVIEQIRLEKRGAFAVWFQDPAYLAVGIPSGITGIITLIGSFWMNK